jgi:hypothetical protein
MHLIAGGWIVSDYWREVNQDQIRAFGLVVGEVIGEAFEVRAGEIGGIGRGRWRCGR